MQAQIGYHCSLFYPFGSTEPFVHKLNDLPLCCLLAKYFAFKSHCSVFKVQRSDLRFQKPDFNIHHFHAGY